MPDADPLIVQWFHQLGRGISTGMGLTPITFTELVNFNLSLNLKLTPWESQQLITMSREYCSFVHAAKKSDCESPWFPTGYNELSMAREKVVRNGKKLKQAINNKNG